MFVSYRTCYSSIRCPFSILTRHSITSAHLLERSLTMRPLHPLYIHCFMIFLSSSSFRCSSTLMIVNMISSNASAHTTSMHSQRFLMTFKLATVRIVVLTHNVSSSCCHGLVGCWRLALSLVHHHAFRSWLTRIVCRGWGVLSSGFLSLQRLLLFCLLLSCFLFAFTKSFFFFSYHFPGKIIQIKVHVADFSEIVIEFRNKLTFLFNFSYFV